MAWEKLPTTRLGTTGPLVGIQALGCMGMSDFYGPGDAEESLATLDRALELGVTLFDIADSYGNGRNEELVGPFVRRNRDRVVVATKFGIVRRDDDPHYRGIDNSPAYVRKAVEASLRRLGIDTIDLYYAHRRDPGTPIEDMVETMAGLVREGKIRHLGLSEVTGAELRAAHAVHPIAALQSEWSVFSRDVERSAVRAAAELGVGFVPYSPLGRGFLTGSFTDAGQLSAEDVRRYMPRFTGANALHNARLRTVIEDIAAARRATPAQVALAWVHQRAPVHGLTVVPLPGTRRRARLEENLAAVALALTDGELDALEPIAGQVAGFRYADMAFTSVVREQDPALETFDAIA